MLEIAEAKAKEHEETKQKKQKSNHEYKSFSNSIIDSEDLDNYNKLVKNFLLDFFKPKFYFIY